MNTDPANTTGHYIHRLSYQHRERIVGFFVFSALVLFLALIVISAKSEHLFDRRVTFFINVDSSEGISQGNVIKALGTEVGVVTKLSLAQNHKIRLTIEVYEGQHELIRTGTKVLINRLANIGNALIEIEPGALDAPVLPAESILPVEETPSLNDLLLGIANLIQSANNKDLLNKFEHILPKVELTLENVHKIISQIATGHGTLGAAVFDQGVEQELKVVVKSGAKILTEAEGIISVAKKRLAQVEPVLSDTSHIMRDVRGASKKLPDMLKELNEIIGQTKIAITLINGELQNIPGVTLDTKRTLSKADQLLDSVQNTWPLSENKPKASYEHLIPAHSSYD